MTAAALLKQHPSPSDVQINEAMSGNFCRCGCYNRIKGGNPYGRGQRPDRRTGDSQRDGWRAPCPGG